MNNHLHTAGVPILEGEQQVSSETNERSDIYVARQPIFNAKTDLYAYELLFRNNDENQASITDGNAASSQVILNAFVDMNFQAIAKYHPVFINLTRDFIFGELPLPMAPGSLVIDIPEDIEVDDRLLGVLKSFGNKGYTLAVNNFTMEDHKLPLLDRVDIVKIDLQLCDRDKLPGLVEHLKPHDVKLLAEKVESHNDFDWCKELGFDYFQGYFFSTPKNFTAQSIKPNRLAILRILATLQDPDCDIRELEGLISNDVSMSYKILRIINSALYSMPRNIDSVKQAILALGLKAIRDWVAIISLTDIDDKPRELVALSLQRARMMTCLAETQGMDADAAFTTGLFSCIDALMDQSMERIMSELPLANDIVRALLNHEGRLGELLELVTHYEQGDWDKLTIGSLSVDELRQCYLESIEWSSDLINEIS
jgi:EAL and modified HD-GYP domain-containing signal transduction protein